MMSLHFSFCTDYNKMLELVGKIFNSQAKLSQTNYHSSHPTFSKNITTVFLKTSK